MVCLCGLAYQVYRTHRYYSHWLAGVGGGALLYKPDIGMCRPKGCRFECFGLKTGLDFDYFVLIV